MTQRERKLLVVVGSVLGGVALVLAFVKLLLVPLNENRDTLASLQAAQTNKLLELRQRRAARQEFLRLKTLSLPADPDPRRLEFDQAWSEYDEYLRDLLRDSRLKSYHITAAPPVPRPTRVAAAAAPQQKPLATPLTFTIEGRGDLASVVDLLHRFYATPLLHRVQTITVKPVERDSRKKSSNRELSVKLTVEALLLQGAEKRSYLLPMDTRLLAITEVAALRHGPSALALVPLAFDRTGLVKPKPLLPPGDERQYAGIARKNIFFAPVPPAPPPRREQRQMDYPEENRNQNIFLTGIVHSDDRWEVSFYDVFHNDKMRVKARDARTFWGPRQVLVRGYGNISIYDEEEERHSAPVLRVDERDVYFWYDGYYYGVHVGDSLSDAFKRGRLTPPQVAALNLPPPPRK